MGTALGGVQPPSLGIDGSAIGSIGDRIGSVDLGSVTAAVQSTTAIDLAIIPGADQVLGPLASVLELARTLTSPENVRILADVRSAIDAHPQAGSFGLPGVAAAIAPAFSVAEHPLARTLLQLGSVQIGAPAHAPRYGAAIAELVRALGGLMAIHTEAQRIRIGAEEVGRFVSTAEAEKRAAEVQRRSQSDHLVARIETALPNDPESATAVAAQVDEFLGAIRALHQT